jgi:hypothetical protein
MTKILLAGLAFGALIMPAMVADMAPRSDTISYSYAGNVSTLTSTVRERDNIVRSGVNYMLGY